VAWVTHWGRHPSEALELFSTIASPAFSELVISLTRSETYLSWEAALFGGLRATHEVRRFKLVFLLEAQDPCEARREIVEALESAPSNGLLDFLDSPPTVRITLPLHCRWDFLDFD